jgi:serine/threonine protein kinase
MVSYDGVTKLVDFGIAKAASKADETQPGVVKGKYAYMSPEQTVGRPLDGRSDVFSLGVCLWELLAGRTIVDRGDVVEAMKVIRDGRWTPIAKAAPHTPPALAQAIEWAMAQRRDERATAAQLQVALEAYLKSAPELATQTQLADWIRQRFPRPPPRPPRPPSRPTARRAVAVGRAPGAAPRRHRCRARCARRRTSTSRATSTTAPTRRPASTRRRR